jgi:hypothetical protein
VEKVYELVGSEDRLFWLRGLLMFSTLSFSDSKALLHHNQMFLFLSA